MLAVKAWLCGEAGFTRWQTYMLPAVLLGFPGWRAAVQSINAVPSTRQRIGMAALGWLASWDVNVMNTVMLFRAASKQGWQHAGLCTQGIPQK